ncbi:MAG: M20 family metallopeptidase, partial [Anaerolineales bacterium]|nr:M20 family metallopeptidase [Anaerolineales bacterium]
STISGYLIGQREAMIGLLSALVEIESPFEEPAAQEKIFTLLRAELTALDFVVEHVPGKTGGGYLVARENGRSHLTNQLIIGHVDTVWPVGTLQTMPLVIDGNVVRGPGVLDMKSGVTQIVFALKALRALGLETAVSPLILINSDEEIGSPDSREAIMALAQQASRAYIIEPGMGLEGKLKTARKGVGRFHIRVQGKAAHAGLAPEDGVSAILAMAHLVQTLFALNEPENGISVNVGVIHGGMQPNMIAANCEALVDIRVVTAADADRLETAVLGLQPPIPGTQVTVTGEFNRPPMERTAGTAKLFQAAQAIGRELGLLLDEAMVGGGSDGNLTAPFTPTLDGLGPVGGGAHASHEFIYIDQWIERTALLAKLLLLEKD